MSRFKQLAWSQIIDDLNPFDIIYFRGTDKISNMIMIVEELTTGEDEWSHVGLVVNRTVLPSVQALDPDKWYVWESVLSSDFLYGTDGILDIETGQGYFGTHIRDLEQVAEAYTQGTGSIGWGKLKANPWLAVENRAQLIQCFEQIHRDYCHVPFNANPFGCLAAAFPCLRPVRDFFTDDLYEQMQLQVQDSKGQTTKQTVTCLSCAPTVTARDVARLKNKVDTRKEKVSEKVPSNLRLFCSEMVALFYILIGIYPEGTDYRNVIPVDFYSNKDIDGLPAVTDEPIEFVPE